MSFQDGLNIGLGAGMAQAEEAAQRARNAEQALFRMKMAYRNETPNEELQAKVRELAALNVIYEDEKNHLAKEVDERDERLLEWQQTTEALKRLARHYGGKLGITDEKRQSDFDTFILDVAEEDPKYKVTATTAGAKSRLNKS